MKGNPEERAIILAQYVLEHNATVRSAAKKFGVSKSTVHKDVTERLFYLEPALWRRVQKVLKVNLSERHLRGGRATRLKYENMEKGRGETGNPHAK